MLGATRMKWAIFAAVALSLACSSAYRAADELRRRALQRRSDSEAAA